MVETIITLLQKEVESGTEMSLNWQERSKKRDWSKKMKTALIGTKTILKKAKNNSEKQNRFWETKKMVLKSKTGSEKQKATVQQLKKVLRYVGMRGKKWKITKRRKSLKSLLPNTCWQTVPNKWRSVSEWEHAWPRGGTEWSKRISASRGLMRMFGKT